MSRATKVGLLNELEQSINPATEDKQLPDDHNVTVSNPTANPETGLAKESKQLANDHDVNVSNQISGFATSAKQDDVIAEVKALGTPTTTALTLTTASTQYKLPASELADRRTIILYNVSDTDIFIGSSSVTTTTGILLPAGGTMNIDCESGLYAVCGTAGKILNILELK